MQNTCHTVRLIVKNKVEVYKTGIVMRKMKVGYGSKENMVNNNMILAPYHNLGLQIWQCQMKGWKHKEWLNPHIILACILDHVNYPEKYYTHLMNFTAIEPSPYWKNVCSSRNIYNTHWCGLISSTFRRTLGLPQALFWCPLTMQFQHLDSSLWFWGRSTFCGHMMNIFQIHVKYFSNTPWTVLEYTLNIFWIHVKKFS